MLEYALMLIKRITYEALYKIKFNYVAKRKY